MEQFIHQNGYVLVFLTVAFSGEFGLFTGVALAHAGSVSLWGVVILGTAASFIGNALYYYAGKLVWNKWSFVRRRFSERVERTAQPVRRFGASSMLVARFFYGVRDIVPITLGVYSVDCLSFMAYNLVGAFLWAWAFTEAGELLSGSVVSAFTSFRAGLIWGAGTSAVLVCIYFVVRKAVTKFRDRSSPVGTHKGG